MNAASNKNSDREYISRCYDVSNLSFLIGTGISKAFGGSTMHDIAKKLNDELSGKKEASEKPLKDWIEKFLAASTTNTEEFLERLYLKKKYNEMCAIKDGTIDTIINLTKSKIFDSCNFIPSEEKLPLLFAFLNSIVNRKAGLSRANVFTLNYDLLLEKCADQLGILLNDGFDGAVERWLNTAQFDLDYYYPSGIVGDKPVRCERVLNFFKLHGSINWAKNANRIIKANCDYKNMLIYPSAAKYDETLFDPFSDIFRRFSVSIKRSNGALIVIGYSFYDKHVNQIILQALEQPMFRLIVIDPNKTNIVKNFPESSRFLVRIKTINLSFEEFVKEYIPKDTDQLMPSASDIIEYFKQLKEST